MTAFRKLAERSWALAAMACRLQGLMLAFVALSLLDFCLTWLLMRSYDASEFNPAAAWILEEFGWLGLAGYKSTTVAVVLGLCYAIALRQPRTGRLVCAFGCQSLILVTGYSMALLIVCTSVADAQPSLPMPYYPLMSGDHPRASELEPLNDGAKKQEPPPQHEPAAPVLPPDRMVGFVCRGEMRSVLT